MIKKRIKCKQIPASVALLKLVTKKEAAIVNWLKSKDILVTIEHDSSNKVINIYSTDRNQAEKCVNELFKSGIMEEQLEVINHEKEELEDYLSKFDSLSGAVAVYSNNSIQVCGFEADYNQVFQRLIYSLFTYILKLNIFSIF